MTGLEFLGMLMLLVMLAAIFIGLPISFTLLFLALIFGYMGLGAKVFNLAYLQTFGMMKQDEFVAVPLFILMGYVCDQAGMMERLFRAFRDLFAPVRGALYVVVILTATLFGIAAGTVGATVVLLGILAGPMMIKAGYDVRMSAGSIAAGGTLGILIPPSVMLVVMAPVLEISIIDLYAAAFGPGFLLSGMYIAYTLGRSFLNPKLGPPVPMEDRPTSMKVVMWECLVGLVPVTVLTFLTLGAILAGLTTASEAAALGALGAIVLAICYRKFTIKAFLESCNSTMATTAMVLFLAVSSNVFGSVFSWLGTATWITNALLAAPLPAWATMLLLLGLIFLLGWPFEWPAIVLIFLPLLAPVAKGLGYDMVWFGCVVAIVLQTAFLSPPVAMSAYYLKQVVREWNLATIYRGMADFMVIQVICVGLVIAYPQIAMWFPNWLGERVKAERQREAGEEEKKALEIEAQRDAERAAEREKEEAEAKAQEEEEAKEREREEREEAEKEKSEQEGAPQMNQLDFKGRTAVVTGGLIGIGAAIVNRLESSGARVAIWDVNGPDKTDVSNPASIARTLEKTLKDLGRIDILINNAGIAGPTMPVVDYPVEDWKRVIDIDLHGPFFVSRAVVPHMVKAGYGRIVNIASIAGKEGNPNAAAYAAAKGGLIAFTKALGKELATTGVLVNAVAPAAAQTAILDQVTPEFAKFMLSKIPMGRFVKVEEIAALACWLASEDCSFSTGAVFDISGGRATY